MQAPAEVNPYDRAHAQAGANRDSAVSGAIVNNIDESSPFGSVQYTRTGERSYKDSQGRDVSVPTFRRDVSLSPEQQALYDRQTQAGRNLGDLAVSQSARLNNLLSTPFNPQNLPAQASSHGIQRDAGLAAIPNNWNYQGPAVQNDVGPADFSQDRRRVEGSIMSRYDQHHERNQDALEARLANQGFAPGSNAWNTRMDELNRARNDASMQAILAGGQEQSRLAGLQINQGNFRNRSQQQSFNQYNVARDYERQGALLNNQRRLQSAQFRNRAQNQRFSQDRQLRNAALQESFAIRNQPINEISALLRGGQVTAPQFSAPHRQNVGAAPIGDYLADDYKIRRRNHSAAMSGLFGLGSSVLGMLGISDIRTKENAALIKRIGAGIGLYLFRYRHNGKWSVGVMAQEIRRHIPEAVINIGGVLMVDYGAVLRKKS